jgi:hypothetical protein
VGHFCPPGSRFRIRIHWPDCIRIQLESGSATLLSWWGFPPALQYSTVNWRGCRGFFTIHFCAVYKRFWILLLSVQNWLRWVGYGLRQFIRKVCREQWFRRKIRFVLYSLPDCIPTQFYCEISLWTRQHLLKTLGTLWRKDFHSLEILLIYVPWVEKIINLTMFFFCFQFVFDAVTDVIIKNNLKDCGLF